MIWAPLKKYLYQSKSPIQIQILSTEMAKSSTCRNHHHYQAGRLGPNSLSMQANKWDLETHWAALSWRKRSEWEFNRKRHKMFNEWCYGKIKFMQINNKKFWCKILVTQSKSGHWKAVCHFCLTIKFRPVLLADQGVGRFGFDLKWFSQDILHHDLKGAIQHIFKKVLNQQLWFILMT